MHVGFYNTENIRGRGAWQEKNGVVFHAGQQLIQDKKRYNLGGLDTKYSYVYNKAIDMPIEAPLIATEAGMIPKMS